MSHIPLYSSIQEGEAKGAIAVVFQEGEAWGVERWSITDRQSWVVLALCWLHIESLRNGERIERKVDDMKDNTGLEL